MSDITIVTTESDVVITATNQNIFDVEVRLGVPISTHDISANEVLNLLR